MYGNRDKLYFMKQLHTISKKSSPPLNLRKLSFFFFFSGWLHITGRTWEGTCGCLHCLEGNCKLCRAERASRLSLQLCRVLQALRLSAEDSFLILLNSLQGDRVENKIWLGDLEGWESRICDWLDRGVLQTSAGISALLVCCCRGRLQRRRFLLRVKAGSSEIASCLSQRQIQEEKKKRKILYL